MRCFFKKKKKKQELFSRENNNFCLIHSYHVLETLLGDFMRLLILLAVIQDIPTTSFNPVSNLFNKLYKACNEIYLPNIETKIEVKKTVVRGPDGSCL